MVDLRRLLSRRSRPGRAGPLPRPRLVGCPAPALSGVDPAGSPLTIIWPPGATKLVAFLTDSCTGCAPFWTALTAPGPALPGDPAVVIVTPGPKLESRRAVAARSPGGAEVVMDGDAWLRWGAAGAPWFAVVADGTVTAEGRATDVAGLAALVRSPGAGSAD